MADETRSGETRQGTEAAAVAYVAPQVTVEPEVDSVLNQEQREAVERVVALVRDEAVQHAVPLTSIHVYRFVDPEEGTVEIVVSATLDSPFELAMPFWKVIARAIDRLVVEQAEDLGDFVDKTIVTDVRWNVEGDDF